MLTSHGPVHARVRHVPGNATPCATTAWPMQRLRALLVRLQLLLHGQKHTRIGLVGIGRCPSLYGPVLVKVHSVWASEMPRVSSMWLGNWHALHAVRSIWLAVMAVRLGVFVLTTIGAASRVEPCLLGLALREAVLLLLLVWLPGLLIPVLVLPLLLKKQELLLDVLHLVRGGRGVRRLLRNTTGCIGVLHCTGEGLR
jgi:hypothetical protein